MASHRIIVRLATADDLHHINAIVNEINNASKTKGTGLCRRSPQQLAQRIKEGAAVIAVTANNEWVGFCYIKAWDDDRFVSTCALIVSPAFRKSGVATQLKEKAFALARTNYPQAKLFGLTTSLAVMKINSGLGFKPVTYSEITKAEGFWAACQSCPNYDVLQRKEGKACLCTAMLFEAGNDEALSSSNRKKPKKDIYMKRGFKKMLRQFCNCVLYSLRFFFILIKKGVGTWPVDTLATMALKRQRC